MSDYVASVRRRIGHDLLFLPAASVLAFDDDGRVLLGCDASGAWSTIGGAIEPGEAPIDAAAREFWEETGARASIVGLLGVFGGPEFFATYENDDRIAYLSIAFEARIVGGEPRPDRIEHQTLAWLAPEAVTELPMRPANRIVALGALAARAAPALQTATWRPQRA